ncbi:hypothetical protein CPB83DRAFT_822685 [Crepidotus variabilis]|uniref:RNA polymerase II-associated protein 1 C-terminal domain-containing protein n=1 Tax=Crepidotus variabilis TaxID=179855 RepID=A0A9P6JIR1_9AGAR|nr:hypothetical protein CPB83DRAFT_822685 [Crepidotus variabilis]
MPPSSSIVGSIVERKSGPGTPKPTSNFSSSSSSGFPAVQHRSKSAFAKSREDGKKFGTGIGIGSSKLRQIPTVVSNGSLKQDASASPENPTPSLEKEPDWREKISKDNEAKVSNMTDEEREEERREILERFGEKIGDVLKRARMAREKQRQAGLKAEPMDLTQDGIPITSEERKPQERARSPPPSALVTPSSTRPSSRADRRLRFAELGAEDVHVYESAPSSPKKKALALPPPDPNDNDTVSLGEWKGKIVSPDPNSLEEPPVDDDMPPPLVDDSAPQESIQAIPEPMEVDQDPEEGSAEYIRQRYFPNAPKNDPNIAWLKTSAIPSSTPSDSTLSSSFSNLRFNLQGIPISALDSTTLPTHLGLHHHAEGTRAGYTLDDIFLLSRSSVPAQRATMLGVLAGVVRWLAGSTRDDGFLKTKEDGMKELAEHSDELRKRILSAGIAAMQERGSNGLRAVEVIWECLVGWDLDSLYIEGIELDTERSAISSIQSDLEFFLPQVAGLLVQGTLPTKSQSQLLAILHRLARQSNAIAESIVFTPKLLPTILQTFIFTSTSPSVSLPLTDSQDSSNLIPDHSAMHLIHTLITSSRSSASEIEKIADSFLRFISILPNSTPYSLTQATAMLTWTLRIYKALASYGLYTRIAGEAVRELAGLEQYVISRTSKFQSGAQEEGDEYGLKIAWLELIEAWMTCAIDPHQTTPVHEIRWSQVVGWGWDKGISEIQSSLGSDEKEWDVWEAMWRAQAAWLEGVKVNGVKGGEKEREAALETIEPLFEGGVAAGVLLAALNIVEETLSKAVDPAKLTELSACFQVLTSAIRLWLACVPPHLEGPPPRPPFTLPFARLSKVAAKLIDHLVWSVSNGPNSAVHRRSISQYLAYYVRLSRRLPDSSPDLWMAQAFSILLRLGIGNEDVVEGILRNATALVTPQWTSTRRIPCPQVIWEKGGFAVLEPFLGYLLRPNPIVVVSPLTITPKSIKDSTTQKLPPIHNQSRLGGLPLQRDWTMTPLDHLLRSSDSEVFKTLPSGWDFSEVEVTRAALFLTKVVQETLINMSLSPIALTREETVFRCMQVFMLEHGQTQNEASREVFRDADVKELMECLLRNHAYDDGLSFPSTLGEVDLEKVAGRFLGPSVPFFQFYTDFVALYDAISFSDPAFARLLLAPTSMHYEVDYRKHLWCDYGHLLKTIRTTPEKVLSGDLREYLHPTETNGQLLGAYLNALLRGDIQAFPRFVAVHHLASTIWPDLVEEGAYFDEKTGTMLKAVLQRGNNEVVRDIVSYHQTKTSSGSKVLFPPDCFELDEERKRSRRECVVRWGGSGLLSRIEGLL